ncbi:MAG: helix-turn-helix transcriptional regulator [Lachnospiraceae bacterium]|nr:helix-turn-helix transcriptional regulator [Lachnospiraceae bacterium]
MDLSYKNLSNLINNETISIRFENIERLCKVLNCTPNDLFEIVPDEANEIK